MASYTYANPIDIRASGVKSQSHKVRFIGLLHQRRLYTRGTKELLTN